MISIHKIINYDVNSEKFGVIALAVGQKNKSQRIFHILEVINDLQPEWYLDKFVIQRGQAKNPKGLVSDEVTHIGNFKEQNENPMKVFEYYPEYFI